MQTTLKQLILTLGTIIVLAGILVFVIQIPATVALSLGGVFFLLHKIMMFQEVISSRLTMDELVEKNKEK